MPKWDKKTIKNSTANFFDFISNLALKYFKQITIQLYGTIVILFIIYFS